jgi:hypothetical protein
MPVLIPAASITRLSRNSILEKALPASLRVELLALWRTRQVSAASSRHGSDRKAAWRRVMEIVDRDKWIGPEPRPDPEEEERQIFEIVEEFRDRHG